MFENLLCIAISFDIFAVFTSSNLPEKTIMGINLSILMLSSAYISLTKTGLA